VSFAAQFSQHTVASNAELSVAGNWWLCRPSGCTVVSGVVVVVGVCNRSQMRTSKCTCLIIGVSIHGAAKWSSPLKFFAVFSATIGNFILKFYRFITCTLLHLTAKWNVILLKNDQVRDFLTWPPTDFSALKMFTLKCCLIFKNWLPAVTIYHKLTKRKFRHCANNV